MTTPNETKASSSSATSSSPTILVWSCLLLAMIMCSSAGVVFTALTTIQGVPPFLAACWRLFVQDIVQIIPFLWTLDNIKKKDKERKAVQLWKEEDGLALQLERDGRERNDNNHDPKHKDGNDNDNDNDLEPPLLPRYIAALPWMILSGFFLGVHFSMWVYSLRHTSLTHSLLWVSMGPILLNSGAWLLHSIGQSAILVSLVAPLVTIPNIAKPSVLETVGALVGMTGAILMLLDITNTPDPKNALITTTADRYNPPTLQGDAAAFVGAAAVCIYLLIGKNLRSWIPTWMYIFPVVASAMLTCLAFALLDPDDPASWKGLGPSSVFGFLSRRYFGYALYLGVGPGILGHTMINALLKYLSPLIISTAMLSEPILGSFMGHFFGMQPLPGIFTCVGGFVLMVGLVLVIAGENGVRDVLGLARGLWNESSKCASRGDGEIAPLSSNDDDDDGMYGSISANGDDDDDGIS